MIENIQSTTSTTFISHFLSPNSPQKLTIQDSQIPTFYEYGPNHPFYKDLIIKALKENRPITEEDIGEIVSKYPYDRNVIY